ATQSLAREFRSNRLAPTGSGLCGPLAGHKLRRGEADAILRAMADHVISPPEVALSAPFEHSRRQLEALLEVSEAIAQQRDLPALFHDLAERLHSVVDFDFLTL